MWKQSSLSEHISILANGYALIGEVDSALRVLGSSVNADSAKGTITDQLIVNEMLDEALRAADSIRNEITQSRYIEKVAAEYVLNGDYSKAIATVGRMRDRSLTGMSIYFEILAALGAKSERTHEEEQLLRKCIMILTEKS